VDNQQYELAGPWMPAGEARDHLEFARTAEPGVIAMQSTTWPKGQTPLFLPREVLRAAIEALETKPELRELITV
jgi:hypothetical protein